MAEKFSTGFIQAEAAAVKTAMANSVLVIFGGTQPATANDAEGSSPLAVITLSSGPFTGGISTNGLNFGDPVGGLLSKASGETWSGLGLAAAGTGTTATWYRIYANAYVTGASTTAVRYDGAISTASTAELQMTNTTIVEDVPIVVNTFALQLKATA